MTPNEKRNALADACGRIPHSVCSEVESCPICGVCTCFREISSDKVACDLYAEAVKRGVIKEENKK